MEGRKSGKEDLVEIGKASLSVVVIFTVLINFNTGEIKMNPPHPETGNVQDSQVCFSRTSSGGSFVATNVPAAPIPDLFPPCQITDLKASIQGQNLVNLTWTAPGDDYDHGRGKTAIQTPDRSSLTEQRLCWEEDTDGRESRMASKIKDTQFLKSKKPTLLRNKAFYLGKESFRILCFVCVCLSVCLFACF